MATSFMRMTSRLLIASMFSLCVSLQPTYAGIIGTDKVAPSAHTQSDRERIRTFLEREDVRNELQAQGVDADTAKARVAALTDEEAQKVAGKLDMMPAGGDIIGILFTIFIVLLVTDILGLTKVFSFTRPIR